MTKLLGLLFCLSIIGCGSESGGGNNDGKAPVGQKKPYNSKNDICNIQTCSERTNLSLNQALDLYKRLMLETELPAVGDKYTSTSTGLRYSFDYDWNTGEWTQEECTVTEDLSRTIVKVDAMYIWVVETSVHTKVEPDTELCNKLEGEVNNWNLKEDRYDIHTTNPVARESMETGGLNAVDVFTVVINDTLHLIASGQIRSQITVYNQDSDGNEEEVEKQGWLQFYNVIDLEDKQFGNSLINESIFKLDDGSFDTNTLEKRNSFTNVELDQDYLDSLNFDEFTDATSEAEENLSIK